MLLIPQNRLYNLDKLIHLLLGSYRYSYIVVYPRFSKVAHKDYTFLKLFVSLSATEAVQLPVKKICLRWQYIKA